MQEQNLDINIVIQSFQEKVTQLTLDNIVKDATIKQLTVQLESLAAAQEENKQAKKDK